MTSTDVLFIFTILKPRVLDDNPHKLSRAATVPVAWLSHLFTLPQCHRRSSSSLLSSQRARGQSRHLSLSSDSSVHTGQPLSIAQKFVLGIAFRCIVTAPQTKESRICASRTQQGKCY